MDINSLKEKPFYLTETDIEWVTKTLASMSDKEKLGQLFTTIAYTSEEPYLESLSKDYCLGGVMCRPMPSEEIAKAVSILQSNSKIPMLLAANLEKGAAGAILSGTSFGSQMQVAATDNVENAYRLGKVCGREGAAAGLNWSFAPVIDIDYNFRNPITNIRTLGSDPERVATMGSAYVKGVQEEGLAASVKHFPGDGCDERDQHLVTSVNDMSVEEWDKTYGAVYKKAIDEGAKTVMIGHIMQPAYSKKLRPDLADQAIMPATLAPELLNDLLRDQLGFNGLIVSDASTMAGMLIPMSREKAVPYCIAAGCDIFLFTRNMEEDYAYMKKGIEEGVISQERLNEAVTRILALKASLGLHDGSGKVAMSPTHEGIRSAISAEHDGWSKEVADNGITLVKEEKGVLPLSPSRYKRVLLYGIETAQGFFAAREDVTGIIKNMLEDEGFEVTVFQPSAGLEGMTDPFSKIVDNYDLLLYVANLTTKSNQTSVRIEWAQPMGANVPVYVNMVPTIFISLENPYHLLDVPRVKTFINTYASSDNTLTALIDKLMGRSTFKGINPSDPFCGRWDTRL